jgi:predicted DNA-binding protein
MAGKKHRPRRLDKNSKTWNIVFPVALIEAVHVRAKERDATPAALVREAVEFYLSSHERISDGRN